MSLKHLFRIIFFVLALLSQFARADGFNVTDLNGKLHALSDYKGKWVLVNFWATWCPPCLEEIPDLLALEEKHKELIVIGIAMDYKSKKEILDFANDNLMDYPLVLGDDKTMLQFGSAEVLPTTNLYNPQGKLVKRYRGSISRAAVEKLLSGKF